MLREPKRLPVLVHQIEEPHEASANYISDGMSEQCALCDKISNSRILQDVNINKE